MAGRHNARANALDTITKYMICNDKHVDLSKLESSKVEIYRGYADKKGTLLDKNTVEKWLPTADGSDTSHYEAYITSHYSSPNVDDNITKYMLDIHFVNKHGAMTTDGTMKDIYENDGNYQFLNITPQII